MRRYLVAGNWKMQGGTARNQSLLHELQRQLTGLQHTDVAVCPPFVYIPQAATALNGSSIAWGAQDVSEQPQGAHTGEIAADMLADLGCRYVIIGHSERRELYVTDEQVGQRFARAGEHRLTPIVCVGESLQQREAGETLEFVGRQLEALFAAAPASALGDAVIAYEPVWAIGSGQTATPEQAQEVHAHIRALVGERDADAAARLRIVYGGSVKPDNAHELFAQADIDGGLIGGASLDAKDFTAICRAAEQQAAGA